MPETFTEQVGVDRIWTVCNMTTDRKTLNQWYLSPTTVWCVLAVKNVWASDIPKFQVNTLPPTNIAPEEKIRTGRGVAKIGKTLLQGHLSFRGWCLIDMDSKCFLLIYFDHLMIIQRMAKTTTRLHLLGTRKKWSISRKKLVPTESTRVVGQRAGIEGIR